MEPKISLQCSQEPVTSPYPQPTTRFHPVSLRSFLVLSFYLRPDLPSGPFPSGLTMNILYAFLPVPRVLQSSTPEGPVWRVLVKTVTNLRVIYKTGNSWSLAKGSAPWSYLVC